MTRLLITLLLTMLACAAYSQHESFDIVTYQSLPTWKRESTDYAVSFVKTNEKSRGWCRITVYKSIQSSGDALQDFNAEWENILIKSYQVQAAPVPEKTEEDGWTALAGASTFRFNNEDAFAMLTTISGYAKEVSVVVLMNHDEFMQEVQDFLASVELTKPALTTQPVVTTPATSESAGTTGITLATTNFDDGWVAQVKPDWVQVTKGNLTVYLYYPEDFSTNYAGKMNPDDLYWPEKVLKRYAIPVAARWDEVTYPAIYYREGEARELQSGKKCFVAMDVWMTNGMAHVIVAVAPDKATYAQAFASPRDLERILNYNKFGVTAADLAGTWEETSGSYANMYNTVTGAYAGMSTASSANKFIFHTNGTYESTHKGAYGMTGNMKFYDQKYSGKLTVTTWDATMTNRFEGKTDTYWCQFEAVKGGRVLHLTDKTASGMQYHLVKTQ